ncbi:MAG: hypothetical protein WC389_00195 [Lutibacter sp.]|jgi:hypothetical protein
MDTVTLSECLEIINIKDKAGKPYPFNIDVYTLNKNSKSGGILKRYEKVKLYSRKKGNKSLGALTISASTMEKSKRNPQHIKNRTRNIEFPNGDIKTIHIRLIDSINGKKMVY